MRTAKILRDGNLSRWLKSSKRLSTPPAPKTYRTRVLNAKTWRRNSISRVQHFSGRTSNNLVPNIVAGKTGTIVCQVLILWKSRKRLIPIWFPLILILHQRRLRVYLPDLGDRSNHNCLKSTFLWEPHQLNVLLHLVEVLSITTGKIPKVKKSIMIWNTVSYKGIIWNGKNPDGTE